VHNLQQILTDRQLYKCEPYRITELINLYPVEDMHKMLDKCILHY